MLTFIVGAPALNMIIEVKVMETKLSEKSEVNKLKMLKIRFRENY